MIIKSVDIALCPLPLVRPIRLGTMVMKTRDYVLLRIKTDEDCDGYGIGFRSGTQLADTLAALAPFLIGRNPLMRRQILKSLEDSFVPGRSTLVRALSMLDLALWDITAKTSNLPLYQLLGGLRREVPVLAVAGFSYQEREEEDVVHEILRLAESGVRKIKVMISGMNSTADAHYISHIAEALNGQADFMVDAHWSWRTLSAALETCLRIDELGLSFIEDPFVPQQWRLTSELRSRLKTPIAAGEDILDIYGFADLVPAVDVLRIDATASGGITGALAALDLATAFGRSVVPHTFPYIHGQLAGAHSTITAVEYIPRETEADPIHALLTAGPIIHNGNLTVCEDPGIGLMVDWNAVTTHAAGQKNFS
jgi:L-alanine-DL-glutamate epimerase-like enolase superfamily enzyme